MTGISPKPSQTSQAKTSPGDARILADLHKAEGQVRWSDSLRDWTLAAIFAAAIAFSGRYVNSLLEGFSPEGASWL